MMDIQSAPAPDTDPGARREPTRKRRMSRSVDEQLEALAVKAAALRQKRSEQHRKTKDRLVQVVGSTVLAMMEEDAALRAMLVTKMLAQVTRPADRELLCQCLSPRLS